MAVTTSKKNKRSRKAKGKKKSGSFSLNALLIMLFLLSIVFLSSAVILFIGLMPLFVAFFVDRSKKKTKTITVGALNIAGCTPFLMELWMTDTSMGKALSIIFDPIAVIVIYSAAGLGYIIDWVVTILVAKIVFQRGTARRKAIANRQKELVDRWGEEVSGKLPLDAEGFPIEQASSNKS